MGGRERGLFKFRKSWCFSFIQRCTRCNLHSLSFTFSAWNLTVLVVIYCKAISNLKRLPVQSCLLSTSSLMSDGIKERRHHFIFGVDQTLWYFKAYTSIILFSQQQQQEEKSSQKKWGVKCSTFWLRIIPQFDVQRLSRLVPLSFKFSQVPLSWAKKEVIRASKTGVFSADLGAHEVTAVVKKLLQYMRDTRHITDE